MTSTVCDELLAIVAQHQDKEHIPCPITIKPTCHPRVKLLRVHVDGNRKIIYLTCPVCDHIISRIRIKGKIKGYKPKV